MAQQKWDSSNIADQKGRIAIVTGSSSGIGLETARVLAQKDATIIIAVRNLEKGKNAQQTIATTHPQADITVMELDLANLESVRRFAEACQKKLTRLDLLINNAGVMMSPYSKTEDGFELQFGTNHLGHFALTGQLLSLLLDTEGSRIVTVSSMAHKGGNLNFDDLMWETRAYKTMQAYSDSKLANLYFSYELSRRLQGHQYKTVAVASHPGWTATDLQRHAKLFDFLNRFFAQDIRMGALPSLRAAVDPDVRTGDYYGPGGFAEMRGYPQKVASNARSHNHENAEKLWDISGQLTGVAYQF